MPVSQLGLLPGTKSKVVARDVKPRDVVGRVLHLGAGVQSSCIAEMVLAGALPPVDLVVFADTGDEPPWVYAQVKYLARRFKAAGVAFAVVRTAGAGIVQDAMSAENKRFVSFPLFVRNPDGTRGRMRRQCTKEYKIEPSENYLRGWLLAQGHATVRSGGARVVKPSVAVDNIYGISSEEKYRAVRNRGAGWQLASYPLIVLEMTRADCEAWLRDHGCPVPKKSSCVVCAYHDDEYWRFLKDEHPALFEQACIFDEWLRSPEAVAVNLHRIRGTLFLHKSLLPLRVANFVAVTGRAHNPFQIELIDAPTCNTDGGFSCMS